MIALFATLVLPVLFLGSGVLAVTVLVGTWRAHAGTFARLRAELAACEPTRSLVISVVAHQVRPVAVAPGPVRISRRVRTPGAARPAFSLARPAAA
ncbi:hypothetical protein ACFOON_16050 [Novosphingobium piscinae]|uniref:Uncharacterized protein n=1 Tax=Novosphingobium piscinae TaxID=1507448 RepID=A0A7X1KPB8_9SPHN|nr:hypothetical protein [Novosphingobium piscinae]MBC2668591.1 hypothetical protein [Novosphingobium piscinae]